MGQNRTCAEHCHVSHRIDAHDVIPTAIVYLRTAHHRGSIRKLI